MGKKETTAASPPAKVQEPEQEKNEDTISILTNPVKTIYYFLLVVI